MRRFALQHYDKLETRSPKTRERALMAALPRLVAHAQKKLSVYVPLGL